MMTPRHPILPGTGRWQPTGLEGIRIQAQRDRGVPSTTLRAAPLPVPGRM
jgi:hypothetical protein